MTKTATCKLKREDYFTHAHYWCYASDDKEAMINVARLLLASIFDDEGPGYSKLFKYVQQFADFAKNGEIFAEKKGTSTSGWIRLCSKDYIAHADIPGNAIKIIELDKKGKELGRQDFDTAIDKSIEQYLVKGMF